MPSKPGNDFLKAFENLIDPRIRRFATNKYDLGFKSKALGWFIQIAVRSDLDAAVREMKSDDASYIRLIRHGQILEHLQDLKRLICEMHVIDEVNLEEIGLSLFDFPTISDFFSNPKGHAYVRQASISEISEKMESALCNTRQLNSRWGQAFAQFNGIEPPDDPDEFDRIEYSLYQHTPTQIRSAVDVAPEDLIDEIVLVADLCAPTSTLVKQFCEFIEAIKVSKSAKNDPYMHWAHYGFLPYIDLCNWMSDNSSVKVSKEIQSLLISPQDGSGQLSSKSINDITSKGCATLLNTKSEVFAALRESASREFSQALAFALGDFDHRSSLTEHSLFAVNEALSRWFPRTYPLNIPEYWRMVRMDSELEDGIELQIAYFASQGAFEMNMVERIRKYSFDPNAGLNALKSLGKSMKN